MSEHGRYALSESKMSPRLSMPNAVSAHRGTAGDFLRRHQQNAWHVLKRGQDGLLEIIPHLLKRISDERTLALAWEYLAKHGGQAPGPSGRSYADYNQLDKWQLCRLLRNEIRSGDYVPGEEFLRWIPKRSGKGKRPLIIQDIEDRVVQRATVEILQPLLDASFDQRSFGFRPKRGMLDALACTERLACDEKRWVWVCVDIKDAFCNVPIPRLIDVIRKRLPDDDLVTFLQCVLGGASLRGLRQGGPLSPLLLNLYLDHFLDRKWRYTHSKIPLIRYADDLLLLCRSREQAVTAYEALTHLLKPAGMTLKETLETAIRRLHLDEKAHYMGFAIGKGDGRLRIGLTKPAWDGLHDKLAHAHTAPASAMRAVQSVVGWLGQRAACFPDLGIDNVYARVQKIAREHAFDELLYPHEVHDVAKEAVKRWEDARNDARVAAQGQKAPA